MTDPPPPAPPANPFADWPNDDLLFSQEHRDFIWRRHPQAAAIFDWPELRTRFAAHDAPAGRFRRRSRRLGMSAVLLGCASLILTAFLGAIGQAAPAATPYLGAFAALLAVTSGVTGFSGVLSGRDKAHWLAHRFSTDRMRQLHFQLIVNNLPLAAEVVADPARLDQWEALRRGALDRFEHMQPVSDALERMRRDVTLDQPWLDDAWVRLPDTPAPSPAVGELFGILKQQRFGIQKRYASYKLMKGLHSPRTRSHLVRTGADVMTVLALLTAAALGILHAATPPAEAGTSNAPALLLVAGVGGMLAALVLALRVLDEGLQLRSETERYEWYLAAIEALERRFDVGDAHAKVGVLREMERLSYQELRWFTVSFDEARFVM
ncbi:MAG: hypothetical protein QOD42_3408 [Sphingomonadales bacterium]|nr:hypothetical protein [Sphingomonadales bacterium]